MPQTPFVLSKAFECGLCPLVVINKIDRPDARPHEVLDETLELFLSLGADDVLADFPYLFASAKLGFVTADPDRPTNIDLPLMDMILEKVPGPDVELGDPLQMLVTTSDWSDYVGRIAIGRVQSGTIRKGQNVVLMQTEGRDYAGQGGRRLRLRGPRPAGGPRGRCGRHFAVVGLEGIEIGDTVAAPQSPRALPRLKVDEPTLKMTFGVNTSPLAGRDGGKYLTSRHLRERLQREITERRPARRADRRHRAVCRCRPRRTAPLDPHRRACAARATNLGRQAPRDFQGSPANCTSRSSRWWSKRRPTAPGR